MLDTTPQFAAATQVWQDQLSHGDVVLYRFPSADEDASGAKIRPCLILDIEKIAGQRYAVLAYGTTATTRSNTGLEVRVSSAAARAAAGLDEATRFVGARRILVPLESAGFDLRSEMNSPVIGRLAGSAYERMDRVRARLHAERDIAADRRQQKRRRWLTRSDFVVEHRRPRSLSSAPTASSK